MTNELIVKEFNLITMFNEDTKEIFAEEMDGLGMVPFEYVKMPSGGILSFELPGAEEGEYQLVNELVGVILDHHPMNSYWANSFAGGDSRPDCASFDGKMGTVAESGRQTACASCPHNEFVNGAKACKNMHRLYFLMEGNPIPIVLNLPPTGIKAMRSYLSKRVVMRGKRSYEVLTKISLKREKSAAGIAYSQVVLGYVGDLTPEQVAMVRPIAEEMKRNRQSSTAMEYDEGQGAKKLFDGVETENVDIPF